MKNCISVLSELSIPLLAGVVAALIWANLAPQAYQHFLHAEFFPHISVDFLVNDVFMAFFFAIACVEITRSLLPGGHLNPMKKAVTPLMATCGGVVGPIIVFTLLNHMIGAPEYGRGWAIPTATDIAVSWLVARYIFGTMHPAISFLLLLAIADDAIGLLIIALFYPNPLAPVQPLWLLLVLGAMLLAWLLQKKCPNVSYWPYLMICGIISWIGMSEAHLHPALALVFIIPFVPHQNAIPLKGKIPEKNPPLVQFENDFKLFVDFGLFFFGLANAGVEFTDISALTWIVFLALFIGKTFGILTMTKIAISLGLPLPKGISMREMIVLSMIASIGLTVALFVSGVAYIELELVSAAKMGALFSIVGSPITFAVARLLNVRPAPRESGVFNSSTQSS